MIEFKFHPSGVLYQEEANLKEPHSLKVYVRNSLIRQIDPLPNYLFKPSDGWIKTNEPESHLNKISEKICKTIKLPKILCFSYKDTSLANRIKQGSKVCDILFDVNSGIIKQHPDEVSDIEFKQAIMKELVKYDLFIIRHYFEHFSKVESIIESIADIINNTPSTYAYIEVPDCKKFIERKNPLFLWEQHKIYFTSISIQKLLKNAGLNILFGDSYGTSIEPSLCYLISNGKPKENIITNDYDRDMERELIFLNEYIVKWQVYLKQLKRPKILYGIGHNSDRFIQITKTQMDFNYFVDENLSKRNLYLANTKNQITNKIPVSIDTHMDVVLGVHDRNYQSVAKTIKGAYPNAIVSSIFRDPQS